MDRQSFVNAFVECLRNNGNIVSAGDTAEGTYDLWIVLWMKIWSDDIFVSTGAWKRCQGSSLRTDEVALWKEGCHYRSRLLFSSAGLSEWTGSSHLGVIIVSPPQLQHFIVSGGTSTSYRNRPSCSSSDPIRFSLVSYVFLYLLVNQKTTIKGIVSLKT